MPVWAWLFYVLGIAQFSFWLWAAWRKKSFKYGTVVCSLDESPIYFWFFVFVVGVGEIFLVVLFSLAVISAIWGPIFHQ